MYPVYCVFELFGQMVGRDRVKTSQNESCGVLATPNTILISFDPFNCPIDGYRLYIDGLEEGTYTVENEHTVTVVIERAWSSNPYTGELVPEDNLECPVTRTYNVSLQGDQMNFFVPGVSAEQANAGFLRFAECP